ncbi:peptidase S10, serine carboxypeptidase [gamma proteobacterium NOR5-3]|nr:peptidase S10, serine carboxypeptidase [gamma proteobacterium NOR5-3]
MALVFCLLAGANAFGDHHETKGDKATKTPEPLHVQSTGSVSIDGQSFEYTATAGTLEMKDDDGNEIAHFGYTAYVRKGGDKKTRPILFAYNGGPGSASMWLHMGILGPQRTQVEDLEFNTEGPFVRVNNEFSVLDKADLVMIDPVGTGFSRPVGDAKGEDFWGVDKDIESVSNFIVRYVSDTGRWQSPKYLLGESYGGVRSGGVAYRLLTRHSMALNGVILVSPYMDFLAGNAGGTNDLPYINYFSTYAATAWYHNAIDSRPDDVMDFIAEADRFARGEYAALLLKGHRATAKERQAVLAGMERFTGISAQYWDRANLRIDEQRFAKELLRDRRQTVGRIDSRFVGPGIGHNGERFRYDPFFPSVGPAFLATFNDYYREALGVKTDRAYVGSAGLWASWDQRHAQPGGGTEPVPNTAVDLAYAMTQSPHMRVLVQQGLYDLATPYGATQYFIDHIDLPASLRENLSLELYEAGHMMYLHPASMEKFHNDLSAFIRD